MLDVLHSVRYSETSLSFYFGDDVDDVVVIEIARFADFVREHVRGCIEVVACGMSMFIEFHVLLTDVEQVEDDVGSLLVKFSKSFVRDCFEVKQIELPVYYGEEIAPDIRMLATARGLSVGEVTRLHSEVVYKVVSLGFAPGFAYLSGLDERLMMPRMSTPKMVAKGSVGIADGQTAVYPKASPGGWVVIGNCPTKLFDVSADNVDEISPFQVGDEVRFTPVGRKEFLRLGGDI